ncbi:hypothetical protein [Thioalkalivibrio sulfidiphilus]|uniref:hypothetical protein n=1 Tax=Thioalkalivibrio sulfidiphilus TaxID=1033854 RepID=UPI003BB0B00E
MLTELLKLRDRSIYHVQGTAPAVYYIADQELKGVLVNAPPFSTELLDALNAITPLRFIYLPSRRGARDIEAWREAGAEVLAYEVEAPAIDGTVDTAFNHKTRFSRTIDFLTMGGVTAGTCALRLRNNPGVVFFGPALEPGEDGWPTLLFHDDDFSRESRLFGSLGIQDVKFAYAFTDVFDPETTRFGPDADQHVNASIARVLEL